MNIYLRALSFLVVCFLSPTSYSYTQPNPWNFKKTTAKAFRGYQPLTIRIQQDFSSFTGAVVKEGDWESSPFLEPKKEASQLCIDQVGQNFNVTITRTFNNFAKTCRFPKMKIEIDANDPHKKAFVEFFGSDEIYLSLPCWTIEKNSPYASSDLEGARENILAEYFYTKLFAEMGFPHLGTREVQLIFSETTIHGKKSQWQETGFILESAKAVELRHGIKEDSHIEGKRTVKINRATLGSILLQINLLDLAELEFAYLLDENYLHSRNLFYFPLNNRSGFATIFDQGHKRRGDPNPWVKSISELEVPQKGDTYFPIFNKPTEEECQLVGYLLDQKVDGIDPKNPGDFSGLAVYGELEFVKRIDTKASILGVIWADAIYIKLREFYLALYKYQKTECS